ncbi:MAG TPA: hypothetical protein VFF79_00395 [Conexibacter sp.]|jgi:hypothetical protein|nr:hypothetical protein [Conexibacter sp.]
MENGAPPEPATHKARKQRSPSYPAIGLKDAIERARILYNHEGRNAAPVSAVLSNWGYSAKSSGGRLALAALKKYGLIDDEGSKEHRQVRLTRLALTIVLDQREESEERQQAIRAAALAPTIHRELLSKYPEGLPSDANLRHYLLLERAFTEGAVSDFIPRFRATIAFAGLGGGGTLSPDEEDKTTANGSDDPGQEPGVTPPPATNAAANQGGHRTDPPPSSPPSPPPTAHRAVQVPLSGAEWVTVQGAFPLTEEAWDQMIAVLNAMKPGLVKLGSD